MAKEATMKKLVQSINETLKTHKISRDYTEEINRLVGEGVLTVEMNESAFLNTFLLSMAASEPLFANILKGGCVFDLTCVFDLSKHDSKISREDLYQGIKDSFKDRAEYVYVDGDVRIFIGIKFNNNVYEKEKSTDVQEYLIPYRLLLFNESIRITDYEFDQILFSYGKPMEVGKKYAKFMESLRGLKLPLSVASDDLPHEKTNILPIFDIFLYLEASQRWPKDLKAIDWAKGAFYCQLYDKSKYRYALSANCAVFKYQNVYFKIRIMIKQDVNSVKYKIQMALDRAIKDKDSNFYRKIHMSKNILARLGFYPLHFDDFLVDAICLAILPLDIVGDAAFVERLINFDFNLDGATLDLDTMKLTRSEAVRKVGTMKMTSEEYVFNVPLPDSSMVEELQKMLKQLANTGTGRILNDEFVHQMDHLLARNLTKYDIVLTRKNHAGFKEIVGVCMEDLDLRSANGEPFSGSYLSQLADFYYDPISRMFLANVKDNNNIDFVANMFISETSFDYVKINKKRH